MKSLLGTRNHLPWKPGRKAIQYKYKEIASGPSVSWSKGDSQPEEFTLSFRTDEKEYRLVLTAADADKIVHFFSDRLNKQPIK